MPDLSRERCFNHALREAAVRCLECGRCFCRECVTEHEDRVLCAACIRAVTGESSRKGVRWGLPARAVQLLFGLLVAWLFFALLGQVLLQIPTQFHEGKVWQAAGWE